LIATGDASAYLSGRGAHHEENEELGVGVDEVVLGAGHHLEPVLNFLEVFKS
jgi:hypothetical protein